MTTPNSPQGNNDPNDPNNSFNEGFGAGDTPARGQSPYETPYGGTPSYSDYAGYGGYPSSDSEYGAGAGTLHGGGEIAAGPWRRFFAYFIDSMLVGLAASIVTTPWVMSNVEPDMTPQQVMDETIAQTQALGFVMVFVIYAYFTILHTTSFSTVGKHLLGIRVVDMNMQPISLGTSALRSVWLLLGLIPFLGGLIQFGVGVAIFVMLFTNDRTQGLHDKWAKTRGVLREATNF
ncbi:hypothetical protein C3B44_01320 [Corynebacterium yudongzhengii]|uniref:RDD family protein n=1 Tax=Corynebacterium yudongzhengii TaxID=2080740 RepID=A0A2U1T9J7_9CORY|nr:RDD family protein [Corynebacterium yudongzhengii]AWB81148.1 hypothetical protein C3B44_01320 [Corynebacterium yudongzhengii]PWC02687.1 RDD family protein [Corynebacterium yudongzhengii]